MFDMMVESPPLLPRDLAPDEYLQLVQCAESSSASAAATTRGLTTRIQAFHLYWKTPNEQQLADYDIELARDRRPKRRLDPALSRDRT